MILLDNIVFELQKAGGVSLVWRAVIDACEEDSDISPLYLDGGNGRQNIFYPETITPESIILDRGPVSFRRYLDVHACPRIQVFHSSYFRVHRAKSVKNVVTVHDCIYERFESGIRKHIHLWQKKRALRKADCIICVSHSTKADLLSFYPWLPTEKIRVVHNGVGADFHPLPPELSDSSDSPPYMLYVGGRMKHKNFGASLELLQSATAHRLNLHLRIVGGGQLTQEELLTIKQRGLCEQVHHVGHVSNAQLNIEYNQASFLFYPSYYEGFGIPPLEAMAAGCPVICSNTSSIPEVVGDAGLLFNPAVIAEAETHLDSLSDKSFRSQVSERGIVNAGRFSWKKTGQDTCAIYKELKA